MPLHASADQSRNGRAALDFSSSLAPTTALRPLSKDPRRALRRGFEGPRDVIESDKPPAPLVVPILLATTGGACSPCFGALRAALEPVRASLGDVEIVEAASLEAAAAALRERRVAAVFFDAPSVATIGAALAVAREAALSEAPVTVVLVTAHAADVARLAGDQPHLVIDVLEPPLAPLLAGLKIRGAAAAFRASFLLRERLDSAVRSAEEHLATVSHDLRNPLNTVILAAQRIETVCDDAPSASSAAIIRKSTGTISRAVERMARLVGDLLDLARLDAGQSLPIEPEDVDLADAVRQAVELIEPLASVRRLVLHLDLAGHLHATCDPERVQQVLGNLLGNAIKFTREGGAITVRLARDPGADAVVISVADTGIGIPPAELPQIFTAFWQQDLRRKRGAGLGLAIAKAIAVAHGGSISVESTEGVGSTFFFRLPETR
jgi:signal transduction histidine kinase